MAIVRAEGYKKQQQTALALHVATCTTPGQGCVRYAGTIIVYICDQIGEKALVDAYN